MEEANIEQEHEENSSLQDHDLRLEDNILVDEQEENSRRVKQIQEITGYEFCDPTLLQQAFTHHSYQDGCSSFERLEYLGDAVLNYLIANDHYSLYPDLNPGKLTRLRSINVDTEKLARVALKHQLHTFLSHNIPLLSVQIEEFEKAIKDYPVHSSGQIDAPKVLADIVESLIGAIHIDTNSSMDETWKMVKNLLEPMIDPSTVPTQAVTQLQELCQSRRLKLEWKDLWKENEGEFEYYVVDEEGQVIIIGRAKYSAKKVIAKNRAARDAYSQIIQKFNRKNCSPLL